MKHFFIVVRNELSEDCLELYFEDFQNEYSLSEELETYGIEKWTDNIDKSYHFSSYKDARDYLDILEKNLLKYTYTIKCCRNALRDDLRYSIGTICLKDFYCTTEQ